MSRDDTPTMRPGAMDDRDRSQSNWASRGRSSDTVIITKGTPTALAMLVIVSREQYGRIFRVDANVRGTIVGRDIEADAIVDDQAISGRHLCIRLQKIAQEGGDTERFFAIDLASSNGTKVNGQPAISQELKDGDRIEIGETVMVFKQV